MKNLKFLIIALVAMFGFISCDKDDCNHYDHSADLVGTWTCLTPDFAEALVINADGSLLSTGLAAGEYWENVAGNVVVENGNITLTFEDDDNFKGHFDIIPGVAFSIYNDKGGHLVFNYCANDLSDEIVGMWVCTKGQSLETNSMAIQRNTENGKTYLTTEKSAATGNSVVNEETEYKVIGDLMFINLSGRNLVDGIESYSAVRLMYVPNTNSLGDMMFMSGYAPVNGELEETTSSWLRVKQSLNLAGNAYAYNTAYVTNAKGADENFTMLGHTFNMANIKAGDFDMIFRSELYCVGLNANSIKHKFRPNGQDVEVETPITVEGNKVTLDMIAITPACRKVEMYMFQDADDTQLHMYMPTSSFVNYFANLGIPDLIAEGKLDPTDAAAVAKVYADMEARVESINVSFVMKAIEPVE